MQDNNIDKLIICRENNALMPVRSDSLAAGMDIYSNNENDIVIKAWSQEIIPTGIKIQLPKNYYIRLASRSGLSAHQCIMTCGGTIDPNYKAQINVILRNLSDTDYVVKRFTRISQMIIERYYTLPIQEITKDEYDNLESERGLNGLGSTGIN